MLVTSFDYNSQTPRFFSRYMNYKNPGDYNEMLKTAVGASSAAPTAFDPLTNINGYGVEEQLIDGGMICNNPSMYAYIMSNQLY